MCYRAVDTELTYRAVDNVGHVLPGYGQCANGTLSISYRAVGHFYRGLGAYATRMRYQEVVHVLASHFFLPGRGPFATGLWSV